MKKIELIKALKGKFLIDLRQYTKRNISIITFNLCTND